MKVLVIVSPPTISRRRAIVTYILIALNVAVYMATSYQNIFLQVSDEYVDEYSYIPILLQYPDQWFRIFTSMFLHGHILHIFFNMWFLLMFGREVELVLGSLKYLLLYLTSGVIASIFHTAFIPILGSANLVIPALGASGAISGVLGAYMLMYPRRRISACWFLFIIPFCFTSSTSFFLIFWFIIQIIYGYLKFGSVAFFAHVGGFLGGIALLYILKRRTVVEESPIFRLWISSEGIRGLTRIEKIVYAIAVLSILVGAIYSSIVSPLNVSIYQFNIKACMDGNCSSDIGVLDPATYYTIAPTSSYPKVVFNRFVWAGILMIPDYANLTRLLNINTRVATDYGVSVNVSVNGYAKFNEKGVLSSFNGTLTTEVINVTTTIFGFTYVQGISGPYTYTVSMNSMDIAKGFGEEIIRPLAIVSAIVTTVALLVTIYKDRELSEEGFMGYYPYILDLY